MLKKLLIMAVLSSGTSIYAMEDKWKMEAIQSAQELNNKLFINSYVTYVSAMPVSIDS